MLNRRMIIKLGSAIVIFIVSTMAAWNLLSRPSIETIERLTELVISDQSKIDSFIRLSDGVDPEFLVILNIAKNEGDKFCSLNNLTIGTPLKMPDVFTKNIKEGQRFEVICYSYKNSEQADSFILTGSNMVAIYYHEN